MFTKSSLLFNFVLLLGLFCVSSFATDYYIDPVSGSDTTGDGSLGNPWETFANCIYYYSSGDRPSGWVSLQPGDTVHLKNGTYDTGIDPGGGYEDAIASFRGIDGTSANPITIKAYSDHSPVLDGNGSRSAIRIWQSDYWVVDGLEVKNCYGRGIVFAEGTGFTLSNTHIYDTDGVDNGNITGLELKSTDNAEVYDCVFNDNYDRICADTGGNATENSTNMVIFSDFGQTNDIIIHDCDFYQTLPITNSKSGGGLKYKHASKIPTSTFEVYNCTFDNHKFFHFATGTANTHFHHNLITGGAVSILDKNMGGTTHQTDQLFEYNTIYGTNGFALKATDSYVNQDFPDDPTGIVYRNNIVYDTASSYSKYSGTIVIDNYLQDDLYDEVVAALSFSNNCYYNPNTACKFNLAANGDASGGGEFTLSEWQTEYGYDLSSLEADPCFVDAENGDFRLQRCSPCANMGVYAGDFDYSSTIDWVDVKVISENWLDAGDCIEGDLNNDDAVNFSDLAEFARIWNIAYICDPNYLLTVNSGSGDGLYKENASVPISADVIGGMIFAEWTGDVSGIADIYAGNTTLTMPASNVTITATYVPIPTYLLTVNNGSGDGNYEEGEVAAIAADAAAPGEEFSHWAGDTAGVADIYQASTTVTMPAQAVTITAMYKEEGTVFVTEEFGDAVDTNYPGTIEDTYTNAGSGGDDNWSTDVTLNTYTWPADTVANTTIIKWDLSALPIDTVVAEATLYLYQVNSGGDGAYDVGVHKIINVDPNISTCTWNTYDGSNSWTGGADGGQSDIAAAEDTPAVNRTDGEYKTWRVSNMVQDWVSVPSSNYGMLVNSDSVASVDSCRFFASTDDVNSALRPKLVITYVSSGG